MNDFSWTDEQWEQFYSRTTTIGLDLFERLVSAVDLVCGGKRLTASEREKWEPVGKLLHEILENERATISQGEST